MTEHVEVMVRVEPEGRGLDLPRYQTEDAAGVDLRAAVEKGVTLEPGKRLLVSTGLSVALPPGYEAQIRPRSGLALKEGLTLLNSPGTIDADYRGTIRLILINHGEKPFEIKRGERLAQMVFAPVVRARLTAVRELPPTDRGGGGFGHTGT